MGWATGVCFTAVVGSGKCLATQPYVQHALGVASQCCAQAQGQLYFYYVLKNQKGLNKAAYRPSLLPPFFSIVFLALFISLRPFIFAFLSFFLPFM